MTDIDKLIRGSIDMHIHAAPDIMPMRLNALEAARQARDMGMRAIVIKNHSYPTAPLATMVGELVPDVGVFGGICLDDEIGGLNHHALEISAKLGAGTGERTSNKSRRGVGENIGQSGRSCGLDRIRFGGPSIHDR